MQFEELWIIRGNHPVRWTIPYFLMWNTRDVEATLYCAIHPLGFIQDAADAVLRNHARPFNGMWRILLADLELIGYRVDPPTNPHLYFSWERKQEYQKEQYRNVGERLKEMDDLIDALYQRGVGKSRDECGFWFRQISNHIFHWLVIKEKPVDLGFIKLHPTHYRQNWKMILLGRFPKLGAALSHLNEKDANYVLHRSGFLEAMLSLDLLAMNTINGYCYRGIEVEFTKVWYKAIKDVELSRKQKLQGFNYASRAMGSVKRALPTMVRIYRQWLANIARPSTLAFPGVRVGSFRMVANSWHGRRPDYIQEGISHPVIPNKLPPFTHNSLESAVFAQIKDLPDLPDLQPKTPHLRKHKRDLEGPDDWVI